MHFRKALITGAVSAMFCMPLAAHAETLTIGYGSEPSSVDPHYHNLTPNNSMSAHIFSPLILQDEKQRLIPGLATSWKPIDDLTWEFKLRKGVKFHDGSDFNADDVMATIKRAPNVPNSPSSFALYLKGKTFEKVDDYTIRIKSETPYPLMAVDVSTIHIVSDKAVDASTEDFNSGKASAGTGPYKFVEWVPGDRLVLERNEAYWGDKPEWDKVVYKPIKSGPARVAALLAGDVDFIDNVPTIDISRLEKDPKLSLSQGISNRIIYLHMDQFREDSPDITAKDGSKIKNPLLDPKVRHALSKAINRELIVERVMEGVAIPAGQLLPDGFFGVSPNLKADAYDPEGAKKMIAEAGYPNGFKMKVHGPNDRYINDAKILEAVAQMFSRIGIETSVETMTKSVFFKRASAGSPEKTPEFSFILVGWGSGTGEASSPLKSLLATYDKSKGMGASNRGRHSSAKMDAALSEALATVDDDKRAALLAKATDIGIGENMGIIPLHYQVNTWAAKKGLKYNARTDERTYAMGVVSK
ncbi:MAG: ABC transporter substrate-binding protein [Rhodospirillales bacterium]